MSRSGYILARGDLSSALEGQFRAIGEKIATLALNQVEGSGATQTQASLLASYSIEALQLNWEAEDVSREEVTVERPSDFGGTFKRQEVLLRIRVPFSGEKDLFSFSPTGISLNAPRAVVCANCLEFSYQAPSHDLKSLRERYDWDARLTKEAIPKVNERVEDYNRRLPERIQAAMEARRKKLHSDDEGLASLGFKIRRHDEPAATVSFPVTRKIVTPPPMTRPGPVTKPNHALETAAYEDILGNLAGMSVAIERSPSTFADIGEEALRDWFLVALNGHFRGDATGETFSREGKTDISIRVNGGVIFIAECKFWGGEKVLLETIDQLLGYLTWRDSKAAILLFSRNADFTAVLSQIATVFRNHGHFVRQVRYASESGFRFFLRDKTDSAREHLVTLLVFNIPRAKA